MAEIKDVCEFVAKQDSITFTTKTNGDSVYCKGLHISAEDGAALAYMIQNGNDLRVEIKEV
jgi:hypothetical protein